MKSFRSKASRFFRDSPSSDEKIAMDDHSDLIFSAGIDMDSDPVLNDIDPAIDAAIDTAVRAGIHGCNKKHWFFGSGDKKSEKSLPVDHHQADDFDRLPEYQDDSDDEITALPQLPRIKPHRSLADDSTLAQAIRNNDPAVPLPLSPRLRRKDNTFGPSNEANDNESPPTPPPKPLPIGSKDHTNGLSPKTSQNHINSSSYSLFPKTDPGSTNGSTVGLINDYNRMETPQFLSSTPEPNRNKGGFSGFARLKKSYASLKSKSSQFFKKENVPSPPPPPPPPQIPVDVAMDILYGSIKNDPVTKTTKKKVANPFTKAAPKPPLKSPSTPRLFRPSSAVPLKTTSHVRTLGISRPKPLPSSPNLCNHPNFSVPTVVPPRPRTAVSIAPPRPSRPEPFDYDTVSFMQDPATRMHVPRQFTHDGSSSSSSSIGRAAREPIHTIESRLGLPVGFAPLPPRGSRVLASPLAAQVPVHTSLRESSGLGMPFRYSQFDEEGGKVKGNNKSKGKQRASVAVEECTEAKGKERASVGSQEEEEDSIEAQQQERASAAIFWAERVCACGATDCASSSTASPSTAAAAAAVASTAAVVVEKEGQQERTAPIERYSAEQENDWVLEKKVSSEGGGGSVYRNQDGSFHFVPDV